MESILTQPARYGAQPNTSNERGDDAVHGTSNGHHANGHNLAIIRSYSEAEIRHANQCSDPHCECQKPNGRVHCPAHDDQNPSLSVSTNGRGTVLWKCFAGCTQDAVTAAITGRMPGRNSGAITYPTRRANALVKAPTKGKQPAKGKGKAKPHFEWNAATIYDYTDETNALLFQVGRIGHGEGKDFRQRRPDGRGGWIGALENTRRVLYNLPDVLRAKTVVICEGEKAADALNAELKAEGLYGDIVATTNPQGAGKWKKYEEEYSASLAGKTVFIYTDNNQVGRDHGAQVAQSLHGKAIAVKVVDLPDLADKQGADDWLNAGHTIAELLAMAESAPQWEPALDAARNEEYGSDGKKSQADILLEIAQREAVVIRNEKDESFAIVQRDGAAFTYPLNSTAFRSLLSARHHELTGRAASNNGALQAVITTLHGYALREKVTEVFVRVAASESVIYYDLGDQTGRVVEITADGWRILPTSPVPFLRPCGMLPQVEPRRGGELSALLQLINISEEDFILYVSWLLAFWQPTGARPHLGQSGEQGTGKTSNTEISRRLLDPNAALTRKEPKDERDLAIAAKNNALIGFDNLSHLPQWLSDSLCRLSTGAGFAARAHYTNDEEAIFSVRRPVIFNAITEVANRPDLLDRMILLDLPLLLETNRKQESDQKKAFQEQAPLILGVLLDGVATGLKNLPNTKLDGLPRMADFAVWAAACVPAFSWTADEFLFAYADNREAAKDVATELSPLAPVLESWAEEKEGVFFSGTPQDLSSRLNELVPPEVRKTLEWPNCARRVGKELTRLAPVLRNKGVDARRVRSNGKRHWILSSSTPISTAVNEKPNGTVTALNGTNGTANGTAKTRSSWREFENSDVSDVLPPPFSPLLNWKKKEGKEKEREGKRRNAGFNGTDDTNGTLTEVMY